MKIAFASDHGGLELKNAVKLYLDEKGTKRRISALIRTKAATILILPAARSSRRKRRLRKRHYSLYYGYRRINGCKTKLKASDALCVPTWIWRL